MNTATKSNNTTKRIKVANRYQWRCYWCSCGLRREIGYQNSATIEHLVPKSAGGPDSVWNLAAACRRCNFTRGVTPAEEFALLAKPFTVDKRSEEEARNADKKAQRRAANDAAIARKAARLSPKPQSRWRYTAAKAAAMMFTAVLVINRVGLMF